ncbi:MIR2 [Vespertilionid gammaherpesvirus 1]|uniref:MIR2 n=1 Tax=Vespertilionid gammaherpesvirus 1 TaxID=2560830 RepID=A0A0X9WYV1_9GAMA|nr:MIR2 [Myotis gammaherpesvirus 8]AMA67363.1 MIR2 [Vespertilionid gammaherpesvirus 1]
MMDVFHTASEEDCCIICRTDTNTENFKPCRCKGSMACIHKECLMDWISHSGVTACNICNTPYLVNKKKLSILKWKLPPLTTDEKKDHCLEIFLFCDSILLVVLVSVLITMLFLPAQVLYLSLMARICFFIFAIVVLVATLFMYNLVKDNVFTFIDRVVQFNTVVEVMSM